MGAVEGSQSRANGLLISANDWDVSEMGGMSEEIDTAGGGQEDGSVFVHRIPADHENNNRCLRAVSEPHFFLSPHRAAVSSPSPGPSISLAFAALLLSLSSVSLRPTRMTTQLFARRRRRFYRRLRDETSSWPLTTEDPLQRRFTRC